MGDKVRVLLIEDNDYDAHRVDRALSDSDTVEFELAREEALEAGIRAIRRAPADLVLLDLGLPDSRDLATLRRFRDEVEDVPVVVLTGLRDEQVALEAVRNGAHDYIVKDHLDTFTLVHAVRYALERHALAEKAEEALQDLVGGEGGSAAEALVLGASDEVRASTTLITNSLVQARQELEGREELTPDVAARVDEAVHSALEGVGRVDRLLRVLMRFFRRPGAASRMSLHEPVVAAVYLFQALGDAPVGVDADLEPTPPLDADVDQVRRATVRLLREAAAVAPRDSVLRVTTRVREGRARLTVRVDVPVTVELDLVEVREAVRTGGGTIDVGDEEGVDVSVSFPLARTS